MNEMQIFNHPEFGEVRTVTVEGEPWLVGKDVAQVLGYAKPQNAIAAHVDGDDKKVAPIQGTPGGTQEMTIINESGLYSLVLSSKLPGAKKFKRWVTSEVLPSIRKHGAYMTPETLQAAILNPDTMIQLCNQLKAEQDKSRALEAANARLAVDNQIMQPKALFADSVAASTSTILVGELAKILRQNKVDVGEKRLFSWLRNNGYLIKRKGSDYNMPTQKSVERGLFCIKETAVSHSDGHISVSKTPKITGKGQQYFINVFLGERAKNDL